MLKKRTHVLFMTVATACVTSAPDPVTTLDSEEPAPMTAVAADDDQEAIADDLGDEGDDLTAVDPEIAPEDLAAGFCTDDIYSQHLVREHLAMNPAPKEQPVRRTGRRGRRVVDVSDRQLAAYTYARDRLYGQAAPYFGALPVITNDRVDFWVHYFKTSGRREFMRWLVRGESIKQMVQPILQSSGVPDEFFYLAMIESGFSNSARSHARATGSWQFMQGTAKLYGLKINHWVDERRDPIKSTIAAANYLKDLYADLGDWHMAMAAYNAGPGRVRRAIRQAGSRDFWTIAERRALARETINYVPKVLAAILLASNAKAHGFEVQGNPVDLIPETEVIVQRPAKLDEIAQHLGVSLKTLQSWNPELTRDIVPPSRNGYSLRMAANYAQMFPSIEGKLTELEITDVQMHRISRGDTLSQIAKRYKVSTKQIMSLNPDLRANRLRIGREVAVPVPGVVTTKQRL